MALNDADAPTMLVAAEAVEGGALAATCSCERFLGGADRRGRSVSCCPGSKYFSSASALSHSVAGFAMARHCEAPIDLHSTSRTRTRLPMQVLRNPDE